ncbi:hypothetical protein [Sinomicrobium weinanense]|uniref:Transposase DDE domain-containing protein n=1 Tax=Sinomicrobium weinanense TaxID=2842200 RepID=A0A926JQS8_9FLAO|nr:hypothetical protein [Sinomicrobium weinanense]MBC9795780.1 hypothetical protein [Sinomicrobium weinanense]MBU3121824.1 hypothetical protein [Sinomicrobium weinanense]
MKVIKSKNISAFGGINLVFNQLNLLGLPDLLKENLPELPAYNKRDEIEREFDVLKNDFGWNKLPCSYLNQNTVYLPFTSMCKNIYHYLIHLFSQKHQYLQPHYRLKKFIFRFICVPAKWIYRSRQWHLKLFGNHKFVT